MKFLIFYNQTKMNGHVFVIAAFVFLLVEAPVQTTGASHSLFPQAIRLIGEYKTYTVFVLISAHAPISTYLGCFRKASAKAHTARLIYWYLTRIVHTYTAKHRILTSTRSNSASK